jgi:hypothetical protein
MMFAKPIDNDNAQLRELIDSIDDGNTNTNPSLVSTSNSSSLALSSGQTYTGTYEQVSMYASVSVLVIIDTGAGEKGTLTMGLAMEQAGTNTRSKSVEVSFGNSSVHTLSLVSDYFRVEFDADLGTACTGAIQVIYHKYRTQGLMSFIGESINDQNDATLTRSVLTAKKPDGDYVNVPGNSVSNHSAACFWSNLRVRLAQF